jgi:hypothetical protein
MIGKVNWRTVEHYYASNYCERSTDRMCGRCRGCTGIKNSSAEMRRIAWESLVRRFYG